MAGYHFHKCRCGTEWGHDLDLSDKEAYNKRHLCPDCGTDVRVVSRYLSQEAESEYAAIRMAHRHSRGVDLIDGLISKARLDPLDFVRALEALLS